MGWEINHLPAGWRRPPLLEKWFGEKFPNMEFVVRRFKSHRDGQSYVSVKAVVRGKPSHLLLHRHIPLTELASVDGQHLIVSQLWLVQPTP